MSVSLATSKDALQVKRAFDNFWRLVTTYSSGKARRADNSDIKVKVDASNPSQLVADNSGAPLKFAGLPARTTHPQRADCDVYLEFEFTLSRADDKIPWTISAGCIRIQYIQHRSEHELKDELSGRIAPAVPLQGFHLDIGPVGKKHHPICHAQIRNGCLSPESLNRKFNVANMDRFDPPRIPTAPLDLAGVVYMVLHDHLWSHVVQGWPGKVLRAAKTLPQLPVTDWGSGFANAPGIAPHWWYAHAHPESHE